MKNELRAAVLWPLILGLIFKIFCLVFCRRVQVGRRVRIQKWPRIRGPGRIVIGDKVCFVNNYGIRSVLVTAAPEALLTIGSGSVLGGTRIFCSRLIEIGQRVLLGLATVTDTDRFPARDQSGGTFLPIDSSRSVMIGDDAWLGSYSIVQSGVRLAPQGILGAGSVLYATDEEATGRLIGNPARSLGGVSQCAPF